MIAMMLAEATTVMFIVGIGLSVASMLIFKPKQPATLQDDNPQTQVRKGGYIPVVVGRARVAPIIAFISDPVRTPFDDGPSGGQGSFFNFGLGGDAGGKRQGVAGTGSGAEWAFTVWHIICVGPVSRLHKIWWNGTAHLTSTAGYDPINLPSGSFDAAKNQVFFPIRGFTPSGSGRFYWGERDQPVPSLSTTHLGVSSRWPLVCHVWWGQPLGSFEPQLFVGNVKQLPLIEFEVSVIPRSQLVTSKSYFLQSIHDRGAGLSSESITAFTLGAVGVREVTYTIASSFQWEIKAGDVIQLAGPVAMQMYGKDPAHPVVWRSQGVTTVSHRLWLGPDAEDLGYTILNKFTRNTGGQNLLYIMIQLPDDGANMAHVLDQLMFARFPYGAGVNVDDFDIDSLEQLGVLCDRDNENLVASIVLKDGEPAQEAIAGLIQDIGLMISWSPILGKYQFLPIRDGQLAVTIPKALLSDPLPEIKTNHEDKLVQRLVFSFRENTRNYKNGTFSFDDDGQATIREVYRAREVRIISTAVRQTAQAIGTRRQLEELPRHAAILMKTGGATRLLQAGRPVVVDDPLFIPFAMRVDAVRYSVKHGRVEVTCIQDVFAAGQQTGQESLSNNGGFTESLLSNEETGPDSDSYVDRGEVDQLALTSLNPGIPQGEDLQVEILELPRLFQPGRQVMEFAIGRIRAGLESSFASVHLSVDGVSYTKIAKDIPPTTGGTLVSSIAITDQYEMGDTDVEITPLGPDIAELGNFVSTDASHRNGRLIMVINTEIFYVKGVTPNPDGLGNYYVDEPVRARMGMDREAHGANAEVTFMIDRSIRPMKDALLTPNKTLKLKVLPENIVGAQVGIDDVTEHAFITTGVAFRPLDPTNLRIGPGGCVKNEGEDTIFKWDYRNGDSVRSGAGLQGAGDPCSHDGVEGEFVFQVWDTDPSDVGTLIRTVDEIFVATYTYSNTDFLLDFPEEPPTIFWVTVKNIKAGFESVRISKEITIV